MADATTYTAILTRGLKDDLPSPEDGKIRLATDSEQLFIDFGTSHIEITDFVKGYDASTILDTTSPLDKIYVSSDTLQLYYYDTTNESWINLIGNHTHTSAQIIDLGDLATLDYITVANVDSTDGLDFGDEDEDEEE